FVILGLLGANLGSAAGQIALEIVSPTPDAAMGSDAQIAVDGLTGLTVLALLIALIFVKGRKANAAILVLLVAILFGSSVVELMVRRATLSLRLSSEMTTVGAAVSIANSTISVIRKATDTATSWVT